VDLGDLEELLVDITKSVDPRLELLVLGGQPGGGRVQERRVKESERDGRQKAD
jgi:hypothetical protein